MYRAPLRARRLSPDHGTAAQPSTRVIRIPERGNWAPGAWSRNRPYRTFSRPASHELRSAPPAHGRRLCARHNPSGLSDSPRGAADASLVGGAADASLAGGAADASLSSGGATAG